MFQGSSSHATLGAAVQISKVVLMIAEQYFLLGNVEEAALFLIISKFVLLYMSIVWEMQLGTGLQILPSSWWFGLVYFYFFPIRII